MIEGQPTTEDVLRIVSDIVLPLAALDRTMVMPSDKNRHENVAEHSYMLGTVACALAGRLDETLDVGLVAQFALVHDIVEVHAGDTTVWASPAELADKQRREEESLRKISNDHQAFPWITRTIETYEKLDTPESRYVYALDKMLAHMLIIVGDYHPVRPTWEAYLKTEETARGKIALYPLLSPYFEDLCQTFRGKPHFFQPKA